MVNCDHCAEDAIYQFDDGDDDEEHDRAKIPSTLVECESQIVPFLLS